MAEAIPMPSPPRIRKPMNMLNEPAVPVPIALMVNSTAATSRLPFLPNRSPNQPDNPAPPTQPIRAELMAIPCKPGD